MKIKFKYFVIVAFHYLLLFMTDYMPFHGYSVYADITRGLIAISGFVFVVYSFRHKRWVASAFLVVYTLITFLMWLGYYNGL